MILSTRRDLTVSYGILMFAAIALVTLFALFSRLWEFIEPFPRVPLFLLWLVAPVLLMALNTWVVGHFLLPGESGWMFRGGALFFLASGAVIYSNLFFPDKGGQMDVNLVFLFGPFYHFFAVAAVTVGYLSRSLQILLERKKDR
jgi:hypothetical protein